MEKREIKGKSVEQLTGIASWEWDIINDTWYVSDNWVKIHGCITSQLNSSQLFTIAHPEDRPTIEDAFHKALEEGIPYDIYHRIIRQDTGEIRYIYAKGVVECNDLGKPITLMGVVQDITDLKLTELALKKSEELLIETQKLTKVGGWEWDVMKQILTWTDEVYRIHDFSSEERKLNGLELISRSINCYHPDYQKKIAEAFKRCIKEGESYDLEIPFTSAKGRKLWVRTIGRAVKDKNKVVRVVGNIMDITDRKQADEKLIQAHETYLGIINSIKESIYILDKDGVFLEVNQAAITSYGLRREDLIGNTLEVLSADEKNDLPWVAEMITKAFKGQPQRFEFWGTRKDGTEFPDEVTLTKGVFFGKKVVIALARNITDRKQTEKALQEREEMMRSSQSVAHICSYSTNLNETDIEKSFWVCSPEFYKIFGIDETYPHTIEGWGRFIHPDFREELMAYHESVIKERKSFNHEYKIIRINDGAERWVQGTGELVYDEQGKPIRMHGAIQDITERRKADQDLRESEERFRSLFENASIGIYRSNPHGKILMANPTLVNMLGYSSFEELAKSNSLPDGCDPIHKENTFQQQIDERGETHAIESVWKTKDGTTIFVSESARAFKDEKGEILYYQGTVEDITYRKQAEKIQKELEIANNTARFKQNFLANMSHEIRTPLTGVMGMIDILEQTPLSHIQRDYLDTIKTSGENLREIIDQVLDFSKIEAGKVSIYTRVFEFSSLPHNAEALYKNNAKAGIKFLNIIDPNIPAWIEADKARLAQVLNNLVSNAVKFTSRGIITIHSSLLSSDSENGKVIIKVEVTDTGLGIPEDLQRKLFIPFSQVEALDTRSYEGTGLGLSICKQLVKMMGGEIGMNSEDGKGSKFWFTFPARTAQKTQVIAQEKVASVSPKKLNILFAEDKVVNQKVVKIMLTSMGHEVCIARNGQEAIDLYQTGRFDIILMDIQMPVMDGVTATKKLKEEHKSLPPIVGLSANAFEGDREKYMALGMDDYLTKPVKKADFEQMVAKILTADPETGY